MFRLFLILYVAIALALTLILIFEHQFNVPEVQADPYEVYHVPTADMGFDFYIHDVRHGLRVNLSKAPCFKHLIPEALTGSTGRYLFVAAEDGLLFVKDSLSEIRCALTSLGHTVNMGRDIFPVSSRVGCWNMRGNMAMPEMCCAPPSQNSATRSISV